MYTDGQAARELGEYGKIPEHRRDREAFRRRMLEKARALVDPETGPDWYQEWSKGSNHLDETA